MPLRFPPLFVFLALAAVFLRGLLPMGYMPDFSRASGLEMTICTLYGPEKIHVDTVTGKPVSDKPAGGKSAVKDVCPYHVTGFSVSPPPIATLDKPVFRTAQKSFAVVTRRLLALRHLSGLGARAPPVLI